MTRSVIKSEYYIRFGEIYRVNSNNRKNLRTDILKPLIDSLELMLAKYCRVHILRFDLHLTEFTSDNRIMSTLQRRLFRRVRTKYKVQNIGFVWVREKEKAKAQHYHCAIYLNGNKIRHPGLIQHWIKEIWSQLEGSSNHWAGYHNINRGDMEAIQNAIYHISYLAKTRGKGYRPTQTKDYGWARNICAAVSTETTSRKSK